MSARTEVIVGQIDLLAAQLRSILVRVDVHESVARELRTEAAGAAHELATLRSELQNELVRTRVRRHFSASSIIRAARDRRTA